ncbi:uncharacterized protein LOC123314069 [Coccinella septempunctata]|uniref:uncharacterized protein LOC123314069 n=1 Tax=Coccinella septempunctata TaxID=41139 RepID=UPI001D086669|nr:uncharacterized protein LOC123314069 [Coccinella septempunctata]
MWTICKEIRGQNNAGECGMEGVPREIAQKFNYFFNNVVPQAWAQPECKLRQNDRSMYLKPTTPTEILEIGKSLKNKHTSGVDDIPTSIIKLALPEINEVLAHLINQSFKEGEFPEQLKIAIIKPALKKGDPKDMGNYRPISRYSLKLFKNI